MTKLKITLIVAAVAISLAVTLLLHRNAQTKLRENDAVLRQQDEQLTELIAEQRKLSNNVAEVKNPANNQLNELARLRNQAQELQKKPTRLALNLKAIGRHAYPNQPRSPKRTRPNITINFTAQRQPSPEMP